MRPFSTWAWMPVLAMSAGLLGLTFCVFLQTADHDFTRFDDPAYITENPVVLSGLTAKGVKWAFTTRHIANWHPLTWISHMVDVELFGLDAGKHHLASVALHGWNAVLLFLFLKGATGAFWRCGLVAALFAVHPLHVESVAWAAERKDLLCAFFWLLSMGSYGAWARRKTAGLYVATGVFLALSLLSKPMSVTAPLTFLLLDFWPLGRIRGDAAGVGDGGKLPFRRLLIEKIPFFLLSAASSVATILAQLEGGAVRSFAPYPLQVRLANAATSYAGYLWKTVYPVGLAVYYPHPLDSRGGLPWAEVGASVLFLAAVTAAALRSVRRFPALSAGWAWYLLTLVPVAGLVQVGDQAMADRYTYMPLLGIFVVLAWGGGELLRVRKGLLRAALPVTGIAVVAAALLAHRQTGYWKDSSTLFRHALAVTSGNWVIHYNLGCVLQAEGRYAEAVGHFRETLSVRPGEPSALLNLGYSLSRLGDDVGAIAAYRGALAARPDYVEARTNLGNALLRRGYTQEAIVQFRNALAGKPDDVIARLALAAALNNAGSTLEAEAEYREALRRAPDDPDAHNDFGMFLAGVGKRDEAAHHFREALRIQPGHTAAAENLRRLRPEVRQAVPLRPPGPRTR